VVHTGFAAAVGRSLIGCIGHWDRGIAELVAELRSLAVGLDNALAVVAVHTLGRTGLENHSRQSGLENRSSVVGIDCMGQT